MAAGIGSGLGSVVSSLVLQSGLSYTIVFILQGCALGMLGLGMSLTSSAVLSGMRTSCAPGTIGLSLVDLSRNKMYRWTTLALSTFYFGMAGIPYLWIRVFRHTWNLSEADATYSSLIVGGIGSGFGVTLGPRYLDRVIGGFNSAMNIKRCLEVIRIWSFVVLILSVICITYLFGHLLGLGLFRSVVPLWACFVLLFGFISAGLAPLTVISVHDMPEDSRSFAVGVQMTVRQLFAFTCGPLLPGIVMDMLGNAFHWTPGGAMQLCAGFAFVLLVVMLAIPFLGRALATVEQQIAVSSSSQERQQQQQQQNVR
eukprot:TRINITY_DN12747_c0_g1_i2.p1 TRINITY_DN12747_c0_g1~~TRINITY_DN12747_c0_g1_i2.p1  ORF type:complete len:320 (-),score=41.40 TRINITY_DN12747_c0_g1_i2:92-1027(-)